MIINLEDYRFAKIKTSTYDDRRISLADQLEDFAKCIRDKKVSIVSVSPTWDASGKLSCRIELAEEGVTMGMAIVMEVQL